MSSRLALAAALAAITSGATATGTMAAQATIGGVAIALPTPAGFCELSASNPADNRMLSTLGSVLDKSGLKLLGFSADCHELDDWHAARRPLLDDFAQYETSLGLMDRTVPASMIKAVCAASRAHGEKIGADRIGDIKTRIEEASSRIKINETKFLGVLAEDPDACYVGLLQRIHTETGTDKTQVNVFANTIVKGKFVFVYRIAVYAGAETVADLLAKLRATVAALYAANK